ncbi:MAG: tRNA lysidine(34) synthetase TilS, partial [Actinobacteria bacterium]|nr:tRNA lysidine(34) synthetase TilS [Actinomycetota bacterium]
GLQPGSAERAAAVAAVLTRLGLDPVLAIPVTVADGPGGEGPAAAARTARYRALDEAASQTAAAAVLLAHTRDDQAETVLLGLARGSGTRSLAGMPPRRGRYRRPLLAASRATLRAACAALGLEPWEDPQNADPAYTRARVRHQALPALEAALGPGVTEALARTAGQLRADAEVLDERAGAEAQRRAEPGGSWPAAQVARLPAAIRHRVLRAAALGAGCPPGALGSRHIAALETLVTRWQGQRWADLPGGVRAQRRYGKLLFTAGPHRAGPPELQDAEGIGGRE